MAQAVEAYRHVSAAEEFRQLERLTPAGGPRNTARRINHIIARYLSKNILL
jgi:hypothetical protein